MQQYKSGHRIRRSTDVVDLTFRNQHTTLLCIFSKNGLDPPLMQTQDIQWLLGGVLITLPAGHTLPLYKKIHPQFDCFLPHLAAHMNDTDLVIDVGANIGDTLVAMASANPKLRYICIEGDEAFIHYMHKNIHAIEQIEEDVSITVIHALVGQHIKSATLSGTNSTKHATLGLEGRLTSSRLDDLLEICSHPEVRLIKIDVDGFDWDVLASATAIIKASKPLLFFELQTESNDQVTMFRETLVELETAGYSYFGVFDNFGALMLRANNITPIIQLVDYIQRQNEGTSTRTIYYLDILAAHTDDEQFISGVMDSY